MLPAIEAAGVNMAAMVAMAFIFGVILGTGLAPAPTYILVAIVIGGPFMKAGVDPWVVHFFAFFIAVFGELTPPTSITAAITSKITHRSHHDVAFGADLRLAVHADGRRVRASRTGHQAQPRSNGRRIAHSGGLSALPSVSGPPIPKRHGVDHCLLRNSGDYWIVVRRRILAPSEPDVVEIDSALAGAPITSSPLGRMS